MVTFADLVTAARQLFYGAPTYIDKDGEEIQTALSAATMVVDDHVKTVEDGQRLLEELRQSPDTDWQAINAQLMGSSNEQDRLNDTLITAVTIELRRDPELSAEEDLRTGA